MIWQQLELMEAGKIATIERNGSETVDTTAHTVKLLLSGLSYRVDLRPRFRWQLKRKAPGQERVVSH